MQKRQQQTFETQAKDNMKNDVKKCASGRHSGAQNINVKTMLIE